MDACRSDLLWACVSSITGDPALKEPCDHLGLLGVGAGSLCSCVGGSFNAVRTGNSRYISAMQGIRERYQHPLQIHGPAATRQQIGIWGYKSKGPPPFSICRDCSVGSNRNTIITVHRRQPLVSSAWNTQFSFQV